jgi:hypothetical protein
VTQWSINKINAPQAWDYSLGGGVTIAILDSGVDGNHPDLAGKPTVAEIDKTNGASSDAHHGTSVAGTAAANTNNGVGIAGIGWDSRILAIKVLDSTGTGLASWPASGIYDATDRGAKVINMSLGGDADSQSVRDAVAYALAHGVVLVASVGNDSGTGATYPASIPGVIGVGASTQADGLATFSNRGPGLDISAPGVNLPAPGPGGTYAAVSGTSFSSPIVAGVAALLLALNYEPSTGIEDRLRETGVDLSGGNGKRVDAGAALALLHAYPGFTGGTRVTVGNVTADTGSEVVTGAARGGLSHVKVFTNGFAERSGFIAYGAFGGGVDVATGNVNGSGLDEIITGAGPGGGPHVRVWTPDGGAVGGTGFFAYPSGFTGGVNVASGDVDGDGTDEIITGAGPGGWPHVRIFRADGTPIGGFLAYSQAFSGGVDVAAVDIDGDGDDEIVTGAGAGGGPHVRVFNANGTEVVGFMAYSQAYTGGVRVGALAGSGGFRQIVTGPGSGGGPHVRLFNANGTVRRERMGFPQSHTGGVDVTMGPFGPLIGDPSRDTAVRTSLGAG